MLSVCFEVSGVWAVMLLLVDCFTLENLKHQDYSATTHYNPEDLNPHQHHSEDLGYNINLAYSYILSVQEIFYILISLSNLKNIW